MNIDANAAVQTEASIVVDASPPTVWAVLTDVATWPDWNPLIDAADLPSLSPGSAISWRAAGWTIASTLTEVDPPRRLVWQGTNQDGITGIHVWTIEATDGGSLVRTRESLSGLQPQDAPALTAQLHEFLAHWLGRLRDRAQSPAASAVTMT